MATGVLLSEVIEALEMLTDEATTYINRKTGELVMVTNEEAALVETDDPEEIAEEPQWQQEILPKVREVLGSEDFLPLPGKFDIHEWSIMERFARSVADGDLRDELEVALHGRGAFGRFKEALHRRSIADAWYRFRDAALEEIAIEFLEAHGIEFRREPRQK